MHPTKESLGFGELTRRHSIFRGNGPKTHIHALRIHLIKGTCRRLQACRESWGDGGAARRETAGIKEPERNGKFNFLKPL